MNRRKFLGSLGIAGAGLTVPSFLWPKTSLAALPGGILYEAPARLPKIINIFLYGGPSELAGNLTNITEISANSQTTYEGYMLPATANNVVTSNGFWGPSNMATGANSAGGDIMEYLINSGDMSLYRTMNRIKDNNRGHGRSVAQNQVGNINPSSPGIASTLSAILAANYTFSKDITELLLPVVSFEGESLVFRNGDLTLPLALKAVALTQDFDNPYERILNTSVDVSGITNSEKLEELARSISSTFGETHNKINDAFSKRSALDTFLVDNFSESGVNDKLSLHTYVNRAGETILPGTDTTGANQGIRYPNTKFGDRLKAAVSLALYNPDTYFISLDSDGLGGWDDHSDALDRYSGRMNQLMEALEMAMYHINAEAKLEEDAGVPSADRIADKIIINVYGEFGRNVNLNGSKGWDHGTNQNFYTFGGKGIPGRVLGKLVGKTERIGTPFENRQFTSPTADSYQFEPFSVASTIYKYFGVTNPELLTGEPAIDEESPTNELI